MARFYRKVDRRFWKDEKVRALESLDKLIALYLFTGQSNRIGLYSFSPGMAAEDLGLPIQTLGKRIRNVCHGLSWRWDEQTGVIYLPTWWRYSPPENANNVVGNLTDLDDVPNSPLVAQFCANVEYLQPDHRETFQQTLAERYPKRLATQEQEHYQEQEHEHYSPPLAPLAGGLSVASAGPTIPTRSSRNGTGADDVEGVLATELPWGSPEALVALYHELVPPDHPRVATLSPARHKNLVAALKKFPERAHWELVFSELSQSPFLLGQRPSKDHPHFRADLDWLLQGGRQAGSVENHVKVAEGKYRDAPVPLSAGAQSMMTWRPKELREVEAR